MSEVQEEKKEVLKFHDGMRQWTPGTWPVHHTWDEDWTKASYHNIVDDGTDDSEVLDILELGDMNLY